MALEIHNKKVSFVL